MIVADILMWFLLIMGTYVIFISYWLAAQALFPELTDRCRLRIKAAPVKQALNELMVDSPEGVSAGDIGTDP